ncbi:hypothetical protein, partial [Nostocoides australiense]|uniref:hypothetical protein n=1 Tax=Nostocoides australiense TaxID=99480 RepID=UPI001F373151
MSSWLRRSISVTTSVGEDLVAATVAADRSTISSAASVATCSATRSSSTRVVRGGMGRSGSIGAFLGSAQGRARAAAPATIGWAVGGWVCRERRIVAARR